MFEYVLICWILHHYFLWSISNKGHWRNFDFSNFIHKDPSLCNHLWKFSSSNQQQKFILHYPTYVVPFGFFTIHVSVILSDRSPRREEQKKIIKNCSQWGWNPWPPDHQDNALPTELGRNLLGRWLLKWDLFVSCTTSQVGLCSFLESIEHDLKVMKIQAGNWMLT